MDKRKSAAWRLFHLRYRVFIPRILMYSQDYAERFGVPISGNSVVDQGAQYATEMVSKSAADIAYLNAQGAEITGRKFVNVHDTLQVYSDIMLHLREWDVHIRTTRPHPLDMPPLSDFHALEDLARCIHEPAMMIASKGENITHGKSQLYALNYNRNPTGVRNKLSSELFNDAGDVKPFQGVVSRIEKHMAQNPHW